jgi:hypothetical protein
MSEEEPRFSVMLTRTEVETIIEELDETTGSPDHGLIEHLERRLRQRDSYEAQERRLANDTSPVNLGGI